MKIFLCFVLFAFVAAQATSVYRTLPVTSILPRSVVYSTPAISSPVVTYSTGPAPIAYRSKYHVTQPSLYARTAYVSPVYTRTAYVSPVYRNQIVYNDVPSVYSTIPSAGHVIGYGARKTE